MSDLGQAFDATPNEVLEKVNQIREERMSQHLTETDLEKRIEDSDVATDLRDFLATQTKARGKRGRSDEVKKEDGKEEREELVNSRLDDLEYQSERVLAKLKVQEYINREIIAAVFRNQIKIVSEGFKKASEFKSETSNIMGELMKVTNFVKVTNLASTIVIDATEMRTPKDTIGEVQRIIEASGLKEKLMILPPTQIHQNILRSANNTIRYAIFETIKYQLNSTGQIKELILRNPRKKKHPQQGM